MKLDTTSTVRLRTGRQMPVIGLGTWALSDTDQAVKSAIDLGFMMIDTSGDYGTQPGVGKGFKESGAKREDVYIVTKVEDTDDAYIAAQNNIAELGLPYADLMLIHRPPHNSVGEHLWQGLIQSRQDGIVTDIGVSNYSTEQIQKLVDMTGEVPVVNQIEWTPFGHDIDMLNFCRENGIIIQAYSPLTHGERLGDKTVKRIAQRHVKTPSQVLIRWCLQVGTVPIVKAASPDHQREDINVFDFELDDQDMADLDSLNDLFSALGSLSYITGRG